MQHPHRTPLLTGQLRPVLLHRIVKAYFAVADHDAGQRAGKGFAHGAQLKQRVFRDPAT